MEFASVFEYEHYITVVDGLVVDERIIDNRQHDSDPDELLD
jgi:hypothetical protein